jgi:CBS domain protein
MSERQARQGTILLFMQSSGHLSAESAGTATALPISTLTVIERDGSMVRTLHVFCPMDDRTVSVERCVVCPMCQRMDASDARGRPTVACTFEAPSVSQRNPGIGRTLSRFATCMRADAVNLVSPTPPPTAPLPVVDEHLHFVGFLETGPQVGANDAALGSALEEHMAIPVALTHMARRRLRQAPVVDRDGTVVGVLDDLDALRALRGITVE